MFGRTRKRRFEKAVQEEISYMLDLHGHTDKAVTAARVRAERPHLEASRVRVIAEAAERLQALIGQAP